MAKQLNISFKENVIELELYEWVKSKLNPGTYIKALLHADYLIQKNAATVTKFEAKKEIEEVSEIVEDGEFGFE